MRDLYRAQSPDEQRDLIEWVRGNSDLAEVISGEDTTYYICVAVRKKGLRRAELEHVERYSNDGVSQIEAAFSDEDEFLFEIWKSQWTYVQQFLKQFEIVYRLVGSPAREPFQGEAPTK